MKSWYEQYRELMLDGSWIGLEAPNPNDAGPYFCTPVGAQIIGWDNGIHYCFLDGFSQMVFCVNPRMRTVRAPSCATPPHFFRQVIVYRIPLKMSSIF